MPAKIIEANPAPFKRVPVDPITLDIVENALRNARVEMDAVLFRTAMSPGIREQHDAFPMIANQEGKMVVGQFGSFLHGFIGGLRRHDRGRRRLPHQRSLFLRRRDQPSQRLAADDADLPRRPAGLLGGDVRPHDRRRRQGAGLAADRRQDDLRGGHRSSRRSRSSARASSTRTMLSILLQQQPACRTGTAPTSSPSSRRCGSPSGACARTSRASASTPISRRCGRCSSATSARCRRSSR